MTKADGDIFRVLHRIGGGDVTIATSASERFTAYANTRLTSAPINSDADDRAPGVAETSDQAAPTHHIPDEA